MTHSGDQKMRPLEFPGLMCHMWVSWTYLNTHLGSFLRYCSDIIPISLIIRKYYSDIFAIDIISHWWLQTFTKSDANRLSKQRIQEVSEVYFVLDCTANKWILPVLCPQLLKEGFEASPTKKCLPIGHWVACVPTSAPAPPARTPTT